MEAMAKTSRPYHHGELREALVAAGGRLLEERGLRGFTLRECARRAEVSHAAPAHHFASIDDLLAEIATRGYHELTAAMETEAKRAKAEPTARLVAQGVGYMAFAAAHPALFQLMFNREASRFETPGLAAAAKQSYHLHLAAVDAVIPTASPEVRKRLADFAWATVHGFITLVLEGQIGEGDSPRALKARSMATLAAMAETVVRVGGVEG
jgi:AcrR family transcriptional regulator